MINIFLCNRRSRFDVDDEFDVPTPTNGEEGYESDSSDASSLDPAAIQRLVTLLMIPESFFSQADLSTWGLETLFAIGSKGHIRTLGA